MPNLRIRVRHACLVLSGRADPILYALDHINFGANEPISSNVRNLLMSTLSGLISSLSALVDNAVAAVKNDAAAAVAAAESAAAAAAAKVTDLEQQLADATAAIQAEIAKYQPAPEPLPSAVDYPLAGVPTGDPSAATSAPADAGAAPQA